MLARWITTSELLGAAVPGRLDRVLLDAVKI